MNRRTKTAVKRRDHLSIFVTHNIGFLTWVGTGLDDVQGFNHKNYISLGRDAGS